MASWRPIVLARKNYDVAAIHQQKLEGIGSETQINELVEKR